MRRAQNADDKLARRCSILEAARMLFNQGEGRLPTVLDVANASGLAKGTVYLYFKTKEEIFANLFLEDWLPVLAEVQTAFATPKKRGLAQALVFVDRAVAHFGKHPELLRLDALAAGVLEPNMTKDALEEYKRRFHKALVVAGNHIDEALSLEAGRGVQMLMRTYAMVRGLWQLAQCADTGKKKPSASLLLFLKELSEALTEYWRGALP